MPSSGSGRSFVHNSAELSPRAEARSRSHDFLRATLDVQDCDCHCLRLHTGSASFFISLWATKCALLSYSCKMHVFDQRNISLRLEKVTSLGHKTTRCKKYLRCSEWAAPWKYKKILIFKSFLGLFCQGLSCSSTDVNVGALWKNTWSGASENMEKTFYVKRSAHF